MTVCIVHANLTQSDRFDFRAKQNDPGNEFFDKFVVETRPFIADVNVLLKCSFHTATKVIKERNIRLKSLR